VSEPFLIGWIGTAVTDIKNSYWLCCALTSRKRRGF
jgi:hypothetical protein